MIFGPEILAVQMAYVLASGQAGAAMTCRVPKAPHVAVRVQTEDIRYDFSRPARQLSAMQNDTVSPYAPGADSVSGGLREDTPEVRTQISWKVEIDQRRNIACMWYDEITIDVTLKPKIYIAREFNFEPCRGAILQHEHKHVDVDRIVLNKFASDIGVAVQKAVDGAGVVGPFNYNKVEEMKTLSTRHIESAVDSRKFLMQKEMHEMQGRIDTLEEYQRVSGYCKGVKVK